jgi:hypothetical protein
MSRRRGCRDVPSFLSKKRNLPQARVRITVSAGPFHELGVVVAAGLGPVAAGHQEEVADLSGLDRVDDRAGHARMAFLAKPT